MAGACTLSHYRSFIQQPLSQSGLVNSPLTTDLERPAGVPETAHGKPGTEDELAVASDSGVDVAQETPTEESVGSSPAYERETDEKRYLYISDSSDPETLGSPLGGRKGVQSRPRKRKVTKCQTACEIDSSESDRDKADARFNSTPTVVGPGFRTHKEKMKEWKAMARGKFEEMLLECIVNTDDIPPKYENIFMDRRVIDKVEHVTSLGLTRPKAFSHGVLKNNKVTGAILYGPPGTGKTLLVRGVAKEAGFNMLSISTSEVWQKCHGDDEKMIKAIFSMARKMYPSIVFLDEADAMLGERKAGEKRHLRAMLNKFLMEWDGITSGADSPFILLATNRPNDLDPAVLRRAPVRVHLNLPSVGERSGILGLLLRDERLGGDITIPTLANLTPQYTGSDLKNLCVTAATECVAEQVVDTERRVLGRRHFIRAMESIKATAIGRTRELDLENFQNNRQEQAEGE